jgi:hypothetical protein
MFRNDAWRVFLAGVLCGAIFTMVVGGTLVWRKLRASAAAAEWSSVETWHSPEEYDYCLINTAGNKVACDALMRVFDHNRAAKGPWTDYQAGKQ